VDPVSVAVGSALKVMKAGTEFEAKHTVKSGQKLNKAKTDMAAAVKKWAFDNGLMVKRKKEMWVRTANATAFVLMLCGFFRWAFPTTMWALPFVAFFLISIRSWADGVGTRRTETGRELWSRAGGFHRVLATDSAETRFDFGARKELYSAYVPFAVAAGVAALWAKKYETSTGTPAPQPDWYNSSSIGAYTASQSSSSSSGGGGDDRFRDGLQQDPRRRRPRRRSAVRYRCRADASGVADSQPRAHRADVRRA
jgi:hypothetical protein